MQLFCFLKAKFIKTIHHFYNAQIDRCLHPKILHKHYLQFPLGRLLYPGEIGNKVYYGLSGLCENGYYENSLDRGH